MKPSSTNSQTAWSVRNTRRARSLSRTEVGPDARTAKLPGLSGIRGDPAASPELRLGRMQATICLLSERKEENSFLTSPLIGLIELVQTQPRHSRVTGHPEIILGLREQSSSLTKLPIPSCPNDFADKP